MSLSVLCQKITAESALSQVESFDLKKAILFAIQNSPSFDSLKRQVNISELEEKSAAAKLLPSLDFTATHGIVDTSPRTDEVPWDSKLNIELTESLYDNGVTRRNHRIAVLAKNQAEFNFQDQKNKNSLEIASQFLLYSLNIKLLEIQENQFSLVSKQYEMISKDYYQGIKTKNDFLRFKTQVGRAEIDLVNAKSAVEKSQQELQRLIGIELTSNAEIVFVPIPLDNLNNEVPVSSFNLENHLQYKTAQIQKEINQLNVDLIARKNLPEWFLSTGVSYGSADYLETGRSFSDNALVSWNALLTVKYNFFDWGIRSRDREVAIHKNNIQNNELDANLLSLKSSLNQLQINIKQIQKNFGLAKDLLSLEKSNIDFIEREYRNGKAQYLDLITGLNNLADAKIKFYSAASDLQTARYTLLYHQGKLYEDLLK
ncbi:MAG: TolC family protein [Bdellovibrio sp.]|nr:TolC family protein [Bdellovibrio sp.]